MHIKSSETSNVQFASSQNARTTRAIKSCVTLGLVTLSGASARALHESPAQQGALDALGLKMNQFSKFGHSAQRSLREISPTPTPTPTVAVALSPTASRLAPGPSAEYCVYKEALDAFIGILNTDAADADGTQSTKCPNGGRFIIEKSQDSEFSALKSGELVDCKSGNIVFNGNFTDIAGSWDEDEMFNLDFTGLAQQSCDINIVSTTGPAGFETFCDVDLSLIQNNC